MTAVFDGAGLGRHKIMPFLTLQQKPAFDVPAFLHLSKHLSDTSPADGTLHALTDVSTGSLLRPAPHPLCLSISPVRRPECFGWPMKT